MALAWSAGIAFNLPTVLKTSGVVDGVCYGYAFFQSHVAMTVLYTWYILTFYVVILVVFVFCYGRILAVIRRQAVFVDVE